jgi:hypothetical protein
MSNNGAPDITELLFDPRFYEFAYTDLRGMNDQELGDHWVIHGFNEGRCPSFSALRHFLPPDFDTRVYVQLNPDLAHFGCLRAAVHYYRFGSNEHREYKWSSIPVTTKWATDSGWDVHTELEINEMTFKKDGLDVASFFVP